MMCDYTQQLRIEQQAFIGYNTQSAPPGGANVQVNIQQVNTRLATNDPRWSDISGVDEYGTRVSEEEE